MLTLRQWVIQEVAVSKNARLMVGKQCVPWTVLVFATIFFVFHGRGNYVPPKYLSGPVNMSFCIPTDEPDSVALPTLLWLGKGFQATDVRDKVHAIVGLIKRYPEQERCSLLEPDYRVLPVVVFVNVVKHLLECPHTENGRDLGILSGVFHSRGVLLPQDFPSWVPRWDLTSQSPRISEPGIYDACSSRSINLKEPISTSTMILKGFRVSKVVGVDTSLIDLWEEDEWVPGEIWKTVKQLWRAFTKKHLVYQGRELTNAFGKTITVGGVIMKSI
jgi:hypothetical protein